jgi:hypothetical protein
MISLYADHPDKKRPALAFAAAQRDLLQRSDDIVRGGGRG